MMFRTQGTKYELTQSKMEIKPVPVPVPDPSFVAPKVECNRVTTLVRKSTLYQDGGKDDSNNKPHSYTKYGDLEDECEPNDNESHNQQIPVPVVANFDTPALKTLMMTTSSSLCRKGISKKRFPMPGASSTQSQLFWCMFIACKGETAFDTISNAFISETEFKYETVELLRGIKHILKPAFKRYKLSIPNFEAELISSKRTPIHVATGIALAHQKNILYIDDRLFIEITLGGSGTETETTEPGAFAVIEKVKNRYCVYNDIGGTELERCRRELLKMESIESPVRSISYYKVPDLEEICKRLAITTQLLRGAKKADLYAEILKYIQRSGITV